MASWYSYIVNTHTPSLNSLLALLKRTVVVPFLSIATVFSPLFLQPLKYYFSRPYCSQIARMQKTRRIVFSATESFWTIFFYLSLFFRRETIPPGTKSLWNTAGATSCAAYGWPACIIVSVIKSSWILAVWLKTFRKVVLLYHSLNSNYTPMTD